MMEKNQNPEIKAVMAELEAEYKKGVRHDVSKIERLNKRLDRLLGTEMKDEDPEVVGNWEAGVRGR